MKMKPKLRLITLFSAIIILCLLATIGTTYFLVTNIKEQEISELKTQYELDINNLTEYISGFNDTDGDGYPDAVDSFPNDSELYECVPIYCSYCSAWGYGDNILKIEPGNSIKVNWKVTPEYDYIKILIDSGEIVNETVNETFSSFTVDVPPETGVNISIIRPHSIRNFTYKTYSTSVNDKINLTSMADCGQWQIEISNAPENPTIAIYLNIHLCK